MQRISDFLRKYYNKKYDKSENKVQLYLNRNTRVIGNCKILLDKLEENFKIDIAERIKNNEEKIDKINSKFDKIVNLIEIMRHENIKNLRNKNDLMASKKIELYDWFNNYDILSDICFDCTGNGWNIHYRWINSNTSSCFGSIHSKFNIGYIKK